MILSRSTPSEKGTTISRVGSTKVNIPKLSDFLLNRDYKGILTLLEFHENEGILTKDRETIIKAWRAWCHFHLGEYATALEIYKDISKQDSSDTAKLNMAVCQFYLGSHRESLKLANECETDNPLKIRLLLHLAKNDGDWVARCNMLRDSAEDQLCLASQYYLRSKYQEAIDIYKKVIVDNRNYLATNVYIAMCYYKLDYYDVSQEILASYISRYADSFIACNLKACNIFRLYNGEAAEKELKNITIDQHCFGQDLVKHNLVVFRNGEGALKVFPELVDSVPEARLNLAAWRLRSRETELAADLLTEAPAAPGPHLHILRGLVASEEYYRTRDENALATARASLEAVGTSPTECDTVPGRQCMASALLLAGRFNDALLYLNSIRSFFVDDDVFNFNYGQTKVATGAYREAEEVLLSIKSEQITLSHAYVACLCRCYVMNGKPDAAWDLCLQSSGSADSASIIQIIANDCYKMGHFMVAARAFHMLDRMDQSPENWEGMRGACAGAIQAVVANMQKRGDSVSSCAGVVREVAGLLRGVPHSAANTILRPLLQWAASASIVL